MLTNHRRLTFVCLLGLLCLPGWALALPAQQLQLPNTHTGTEQAASPVSIPQPAALGLMVVTYAGGQLTISAQKAKLTDILGAVNAQTGIVVEMPALTEELVTSVVGPGAPTDVLASLLYGSEFNYVMLGSIDDPNVLARVILSRKKKQATAAAETAKPSPAKPERKAAVPAMVARAEKSEDSTTAPRTGADQVSAGAVATSPTHVHARDAAPAAGQPNGTTPPAPRRRHHRRR